jgi:hypothetical protein
LSSKKRGDTSVEDPMFRCSPHARRDVVGGERGATLLQVEVLGSPDG